MPVKKTVNPPLERGSPAPLYFQAAEYINKNLLSDTDDFDKALPSEQALAKKLGVHRLTVRKAMEKLKKTGQIYSVRGQGTFARKKNRPEKERIEFILPCTIMDKSVNPANYFLSIEILKGVSAQCEITGKRLCL